MSATSSRPGKPLAEIGPEELGVVEGAVRALAKAYRASQMYLPNNPTRHATLAAASASFTKLQDIADPLHIEVHETTLAWKGRVVYDDTERGIEGLPWLLYRDGLRLLTVRSGFETESLEQFLDVLRRARAATTDEDDLVTLLWVADLAHVTYHYVDSGSGNTLATVADTAPLSGDELLPLGAPAAETTPIGDGPPPGVMRLEDFDETLYFLEPKETAYLEDELSREYIDDPRDSAVSTVFEIIAMPVSNEIRAEALAIVDELLLEFVTASNFEMVVVLLRGATFTRQHLGDAPEAAAALASLSSRLSEPAVMSQLLQAIDEAPRPPSAEVLEVLFGELHPTAMRSMLGWLGAAQPSIARTAVERASVRLAGTNTAELGRMLESSDTNVVQGALRIATSLATTAVVPAIANLLGRPEASVRNNAVGALREIGSPAAMRAMEGAIEDDDRDVRVATFRAIAVRQHAAALPRLRSSLRRRELRSADLGEKMALFEAFGTLCGESGVGELDALLNARGMIGPREPTEVRACAARALGLIGSMSARAALRRAADSKDMVVRSAVTRAQRGGA